MASLPNASCWGNPTSVFLPCKTFPVYTAKRENEWISWVRELIQTQFYRVILQAMSLFYWIIQLFIEMHIYLNGQTELSCWVVGIELNADEDGMN